METAGDLPESDSRRRFSRRVADYVKYRPSYPPALVQTLVDEAGLRPEWSVADIGSGTGFSSEQFLRFGCKVTGVEPNADMRAAGDTYLAGYPNFNSVEGVAEETGLADGTIDMVTAGQALHWFRLPLARIEFDRIVRPGGILAFFWNERSSTATPFMAHYMDVMERYTVEQRIAHHQDVDPAALAYLYANGVFESRRIAWLTQLSLEQAVGRAFSSSYMPRRDSAEGAPMEAEIAALFDQFGENGVVDFHYETELYFGAPERDLS